MLKRTWLFIAAFGLIFAASLGQAQNAPEPALENQPVSPSGQSDDGNGAADQSDGEASGSQDYSASLAGIEGAIRDLVAEQSQAERDAQQERESRDLTAQEDMARWAKWMFWATSGTLVLTAIALAAILRTLHHTRRAADYAEDMVDEAKAATKAAERAADATVSIGQAQTRAYLRVNAQNFGLRISSNPPYRPLVDIRVINTGNSPALKVACSVRLRIFRDEVITKDATVSTKDFGSRGLLEIGAKDEDHTSPPTHTLGYTVADVIDLISGRTSIVMDLNLEYETIFGDKIRERLRFVPTHIPEFKEAQIRSDGASLNMGRVEQPQGDDEDQ